MSQTYMTKLSVLFHLQLERKLKRGSQPPSHLFTSHFATLLRGFRTFLISGIFWTLKGQINKMSPIYLNRKERKAAKTKTTFHFPKKVSFPFHLLCRKIKASCDRRKTVAPTCFLAHIFNICCLQQYFISMKCYY